MSMASVGLNTLKRLRPPLWMPNSACWIPVVTGFYVFSGKAIAGLMFPATHLNFRI